MEYKKFHFCKAKFIGPFVLLIAVTVIGFTRCNSKVNAPASNQGDQIFILGNVQDGGSPHLGCKNTCCNSASIDYSRRMVSSLAFFTPSDSSYFIFDATPDFGKQVHLLQDQFNLSRKKLPAGIFLTHAHIGHYTGLMHLGREVMGARNVLVYTMPKMHHFLKNHGPWSQLYTLKNIQLQKINEYDTIQAHDNLNIIPILVPHRDEYSETVGFLIQGKRKSAFFVPDIDKWRLWKIKLEEIIHEVDYAFLDGTFYSGDELPGRELSEIPHPTITETMSLLENLSDKEKSKVYFIHLNHSNPVLDKKSDAYKTIINKGFKVADFMASFPM